MNRGFSSALVATGLLVATAGAASAASGSSTVSCDTGVTSTLVTLYTSDGGASVKQVDTSENNNRYYWGVSSNGNSLSWKAAVDGGTVSWSGVTSSNYTWKTRIVSNQNCNGVLPGNGNSSLSWIVTP